VDYLPIFVDVRHRLVVVVGGGVVAARKTEHLLKSHAHVRIVSPELDPVLTAHRAAGRIEHLALLFSPTHLDGADLVVAATDDESVNDAVARAARERRIWVNVVDDARRSAFIFPAIVDRSPLIVAVGTAGSSPTLARRVRTQIEALLPERLGHLATFASRWREKAKEALPALPQRLRFWDEFFNGPVAARLLTGDVAGADESMQLSLADAREAAGTKRGEVYLIGAGPGDPDLLTVRALQLLQQADVVLHDRLVPQVIVDRARRDAERINVGKVPGRDGVTQDHINQLLVEHARRGLRVARLKGGDPFVFGRGGEELAVLREAGIPVIVVPGITAGVGAAASAAIPLTHRGVAQSVTFVTATGANASLLNWPALAHPDQTVVFYMGAAHIAEIVARLTTLGLPATHPAALIEHATWPDERVLPTSLGDVVRLAAQARMRSPTLLIVGEVAAWAVARGSGAETNTHGLSENAGPENRAEDLIR
jgi:uroporphyrin-III C-methyltransferase/precorrin-2 dehydrogenase/sirohydrochlorin ferrochelatase